jgi:DNA-binding GntR family transcriptional regulator
MPKAITKETENGKQVAGQVSTLATSVYDRIRMDIVTGTLQPGIKLRTDELRSRYKTGNSPIREALNRLSSDGFVVREEQRGFSVAAISKDELQELVKTRCWLEETALRQSIANGDSEWEERLVLAHHRLSRVPRLVDPNNPTRNAEWDRLHREFHMALISACGSRLLLGFCEQLHDQSDRYRQLAVTTSYPPRDPKDEHEAIFSAAIDRNADKAVNSLLEHYHKTAIIIEKSDLSFDT